MSRRRHGDGKVCAGAGTPETLTTTLPVAPPGTVATMLVALQEVAVASVP